MLRVERTGKRLVGFAGLRPRSLAHLYDLADFVANSPAELFGEIGEELFVVEIGSGGDGDPDMLAVDREGRLTAVVVESGAAGSDALSELLTAGSRLADVHADDVWRLLTPRRAAELRRFLSRPNRETLAERQRLFLVVESASDELLRTASWLRARGGVDISIIQVSLAEDPRTGQEFLSCRVAPLPAVGSPRPEAEGPDEGSARNAPEPPSAAPAASPSGSDPKPSLEPDPSTALHEDALGDRRTHSRTADTEVRDLRILCGGREYSADCVDYSRGGLGAAMDAPLPRGEAVQVQGRIGDRAIDVTGLVRHCAMGDRRYLVGVSFDVLQPESR